MITTDIFVSNIRYRDEKRCVCFCHPVSTDAKQIDRTKGFAATFRAQIVHPQSFEGGQVWRVSGKTETRERTVRTAAGKPIRETHMPIQSATLIIASGMQIQAWLERNIKGVGPVLAGKLHREYPNDLLDILDNADDEKLAKIITNPETREAIFEEWQKNGDAETLRFVQEKQIPLHLAQKAIKYHKKNTLIKLKEDPYRLLSFSGSWKEVDAIARDKFSIAVNDIRRLAAALEEALYSCMDNGHTCLPFETAYNETKKLLKPHKEPEAAFEAAIEHGKKNGQFISFGDEEKWFAPLGTYLMEKQTAIFIKRLLSEQPHQQELFELSPESILSEFEQSESIRLGIDDFALNDAQKDAVITSFNSRFSIITGGAGVGKTTVLKALYKLLDHQNDVRFQMALSGRATARMIEATLEQGTTIAGFLRTVSNAEMTQTPIIVIDESSMLDLVTFYRLIRKLPEDCKVILVGDPFQLPPIGAGLIFHLLCNIESIPKRELTVVKRQASDSAIPICAQQIRDGIWPTFDKTQPDVQFIHAADNQILEKTLALYNESPQNTQILCATRPCRFAGIEVINRALHIQYAGSRKPLLAKNEETGGMERSGFCEGDLLLFTDNDWQRDLQNGCLGQLTKVYDTPQNVMMGDGENQYMATAIGEAIFEGKHQYILPSDVDSLQLSYAITVHKSQGSQFERVIIPIRGSRVLDRTFVYTALTRGQKQVTFVGNESATKRATEALPFAFNRKTALENMLNESLQ